MVDSRNARACGLAAVLTVLSAGFSAGAVVINEIHYDPPDNTRHEEFIELFNTGDVAVDLSGWFFSTGVEYLFPAGSSIEPGAYVVVAEDPEALEETFALAGALGPYAGRLSSEGERVVLRNAAGELVDRVDYAVGFPWPTASAGRGRSMELMNPGLDNDLGGSWRASGEIPRPHADRITYLEAEAPGWRYRKGTSEASDPVSAWRDAAFTPDGTWLSAQTSIGYGNGGDNTVIDDMKDNYTSLFLRREFTVPEAGELPDLLVLDLYLDDGAVVWINGVEVSRIRVRETGEPLFDWMATRSTEPEWEPVVLRDPAAFLHKGVNTLAIQAFNIRLSNSDFSVDARVFVPGSEDLVEEFRKPTPGMQNSSLVENAPPQVRQVRHGKDSPVEGEANLVTARVTDPDGVASVELAYQTVLPGKYLPAFLPLSMQELLADPDQPHAPNPAFEEPAAWTAVPMADDGNGADEVPGDGIYTAVIPAQGNRTLVRYRISARDARGAGVRVPYPDDPSLNFAYFVYNGLPDYAVATSIQGGSTVYRAEDLATLAVYTLISRSQDLAQCIAASPSQQIPQGSQARFAENWEGAFVYDGVVYDHITYRLRGANGRYQVPPGNPGGVAGKRHWRFKFNKGRHLQARDRFGNPYPTRWRILNTGRMFGNRLDGNWGLGDQVNDILWRAYGVPAPFGHAFHWRVIQGAEEAPSGATGQYYGDFWGIARAFENYDVRFLEAHGLEKGNLYKLVNQTRNAKEQQRYQAPYAVNDGRDHNNIEGGLRASRPSAWLIAYVNYPKWFHYHAVVQAIRHYDYWPDANKNATWYFEPKYTDENEHLGVMWTLPFDADATWGPTWNQGIDRPYDAILSGGGRPDFLKEYRNHVREVRDLLWQRGQLAQVIRQTAAFMRPLQDADIDRWRNAPPAAGRQFFSSAAERTLDGKVQDMLRFAFTGGSWPGGGVGAGGRAAFLDSFADSPDKSDLPAKPQVAYAGPAGFPVDALAFVASGISDPQGDGTLGAIQWRIAEVSDIPDPEAISLSDPFWREEPVHLELDAAWTSPELPVADPQIQIPLEAAEPGKRYRVRARIRDKTFLWGHWSEPVEFTAGLPSRPIPVLSDLRITELMYHPLGGSDLEFIELENVGSQTLDLRLVRFRDGVDFTFRGSGVESLGPGEIVVIVKDLHAFSLRYDTSSMRIAGEYGTRLSNAGERIVLTYAGNLDILDFTYLDTWQPETDGLGRSLTIRNPSGSPASWNEAESWFASSRPGGTPGEVDPGEVQGGSMLPGDANADGSLNVSDAIALLNILFLGRGELPCEDDGVQTGGNLAVLDATGDGTVNLTDAVRILTYLFLDGLPHNLGVDCVPVAGCPEICTGG